MNPHDLFPVDPADPFDPFSDDAAAYVLGALPPHEQRFFEAHLTACPRCARQVAELRPAAQLLSKITEGDLSGLAQPAAPDGPLLPPLLVRAAALRRRRRFGVAALGAVAASAVAALIAVLGTQPTTSGTPAPVAVGRPMAAVAAHSPLSATAQLSSQRWGTEITLDCSYAAGVAYPGGSATYELEVRDRTGVRHLLGSWTVRPSGHTRFTSGTSLAADEIASVRIDLPDGTPVLQLSR